MDTEVVKATADSLVAQAAARGARALKDGLLVGFATETVYGVAAMASDPDAMDRLRELKSRPQRPFSVHIAHPRDAAQYVADMPHVAQRMIEKCWPGPLTLLVPAGGKLAEPRFQEAGLYDALCFEDIIGLRCPACRVAQEMLAAVDWPLVAPSANLTGRPSPRNARDVLEDLGGKIDLLLDSGPTTYGADSTILRVDRDGWRVVREGVLSRRQVEAMARRVLLFVCTGNTCRSPMAAGLAAKLLADKLHCRPANLDKYGYEVLSAGLWAGEGGPVSPEAREAAARLGADISSHRTRKVTSELIRQADLVFCMTDTHVAEILRLLPSARGKVKRLSPDGDIPDPVGGGGDVYHQIAKRIQAALEQALDEELYEDRASC
ncbi:MAG: L-threonylcarbamoyladenylate synthase [Phycisphaerae bacterium]|jgi:protein-tyrosine phosphatase